MVDKNQAHEEDGRRKAKGGDDEGQMQPPLTPMIDVTFQLLIYFIVTMEFRKDEGRIPGSLPNVAGKETAVKPTIINIKLQDKGRYSEECVYIVDDNMRVTTPEQLRKTLGGLRSSKGPEAAVVIRTRGLVRWKYCVEAFNASVHVGYTKIGFGPQSG